MSGKWDKEGYSDDMGEMDGLDETSGSISGLLPDVKELDTWPALVFRTLPDGTEELVSYHCPGTIQAVRLEKPDQITLEFADGRTISAHVAENFRLLNELGVERE